MTDKQTRSDRQADDDMFYRGPDSMPVVTNDDGFFDTIDSFVIALRWPIFGFAVVAMLLFCTAMILVLPWAK